MEKQIFGICSVCYWENDPNVWERPNEKSLLNDKMTLGEAQLNFVTLKACDKVFIEDVRPPKEDQERDQNWKPFY